MEAWFGRACLRELRAISRLADTRQDDSRYVPPPESRAAWSIWDRWPLGAGRGSDGFVQDTDSAEPFATCTFHGIRELMSTAAETVEIVFTVTISMPEIQKDAWNRFPSPIQNKPSDIDRCPVYPWFAKVILERRVRKSVRLCLFMEFQPAAVAIVTATTESDLQCCSGPG
jgi:hypothetical protein